ncbi:MAG: hypothetical protein KGI78_02045 [Patescibacteria group bacterium]|nr:hypothetical protein [Patescibacteria group bacterium]MDE1944419.1 hypothetical protein [Patescibacteria group bacterium]MDE1945104.1 hypothetical protein [Patescibacteria group bacterium]MDE2057614.1 hypothetical protein [Patescibacteria group bacterium]
MTIRDYDQFIAHLRRTGRLKLLPAVLAELRTSGARERARAPRRETAAENPALISGWREIEGGRLTDRTGKGALIDIYRKVTN